MGRGGCVLLQICCALQGSHLAATPINAQRLSSLIASILMHVRLCVGDLWAAGIAALGYGSGTA